MVKTFRVEIVGSDAVFHTTTPSYDPYQEWIPFCVFSGSFMESFPLQASFSVPLDRMDDAIAILKANHYQG